MKKHRLLFAALLLALTDVSSQLREAAGQRIVLDGWTGTVTMEERYSGITGVSERHISTTFSGAIPTLYREGIDTTDLNFTDDKGAGSVRFHGEEIIEGLRLGTTDCTGSGQAELHSVEVDEIDHRYHIEAIGPPCIGTSISLIGGPDQSYGPEVTSIVISDQPLVDSNVLAGSLTESGEIPGGIGTYSRTVTWNLVRARPTDTELIVTLTCFKSSVQNCTYDTWLPEPGRTEIDEGSVLNISLELQGKNGRPLTEEARAFELRLAGTSFEPGITLNFPLSPPLPSLPDFRFLPQPDMAVENVFQTAIISCPSSGCTTADLKLGSFDGGGWTTLTAVAILNDTGGTRINGHLMASGGEMEIPIPKRSSGSAIAQAWLTANGNPGEIDDKEPLSGAPNPGDGLTAYEEYRGVISQGRFQRLDPRKRELGIRMKRAEMSLFSEGIDLFESATGVTPIRFDETEIGLDRRLNKNASHAHDYDQFVEKLENGSLAGDAAGENQPVTVTAKLPAQSERVVIDVNMIKQAYQAQVRELNAAVSSGRSNLTMPYTESENIANTVAHELAHGIGVDHHGKPTDEPDHLVPKKSVDVYHVFSDDGTTEITADSRGKTLKGIGKAHNDESGDLDCIMAYTTLYNWAYRVGRDGSLNFYKVPLLPVGKQMCSARAGKGINANDRYFGDAALGFGDCMSQIKLRN